MRLSTFIMCGVFLLNGVYSSFAQTISGINDSATVKSTSVHKDSVYVIHSDSHKAGSCEMPKANEFNSWEIGLHGGLAYPNTDISASDINRDNFRGMYGVDLSVTKYVTHTLGFQAQFLYGKLKGENINEKYGYQTTINYDVTLNAVFQSGNISFLKKPSNLSFYFSAGVGFLNFDPVNDSVGVKVPYNYFVSSGLKTARVDYSNTTELVIPFTIGIRYLFSPKFSVDGSYSLRNTRSDKLDGWYRQLSESDNYTYVSVGLTYHLGKKNKSIEWVNPVDLLNARLCAMDQKIDSIYFKLNDQDQDGVADMFDKDNTTVPPIKVYGDGTAVDFDRDSVPDYRDDCPTIPGLAKFRGCPDTDNDSVPDQLDGCPNVPGPVSNHGCPVAAPKVESNAPTSIKALLTVEEEDIVAKVYRSLEFETGKAVIRPTSFPSLDELAKLMKKKPQFKVLIEGHTDNVGSAISNVTLSTKRAEAVKQYLIDKGTSPSQISAQGWGMTKPLVPNTTAAGRQKNRRVEFTIFEQ